MSDAGVLLLESKLHAPRRRRGVVGRTRLDQRLDRHALPAVVLVSAPAGFGKTTVLTEWLAADGEDARRTAWLSLDRRDSDPSVFWAYLIAAVRKVAPEVGADALATLQSTPTALENVVATLLNDLPGSSPVASTAIDGDASRSESSSHRAGTEKRRRGRGSRAQDSLAVVPMWKRNR